MTKRTLDPIPAEVEELVEAPLNNIVEIPILSTEVSIGVFHTEGGDYAMLNMQTVLGRGTYALDRSQTLTLGSELLKLARSMPSQKELEKVQRKLIVPS